MDDDNYTMLEKRQIKELSHCITHVQRSPSIHSIKNVSKELVHHAYHNPDISSIHDKKKMTIGALHKIYTHSTNDKINHEHRIIIKRHDPIIDSYINKETDRKLRERDTSCSRCSYMCIVL
jgi:hypothetical protein